MRMLADAARRVHPGSEIPYLGAMSSQVRWGHEDLTHILFSAAQIKERIEGLAQDIARDSQEGPLLVVGVLTGAAIFAADLLRALQLPAQLDFIAVSSYGDSTKSSGQVRWIKDLTHSIEGRHVLLVEDIVDTGLTMSYLREVLRARDPASLRLCTLLDKREARKVDIEVDYVGFSCPDAFVVGYGLDYAGNYRNLSDIGVLKPAVYAGP